MSFALAGALMGGGDALLKMAEERRAQAHEEMMMEKQEALLRERDELKGRGRSGGGGGRSRGRSGGGSGSSGRGDGWSLSNSDSVRIEKAYASAFEDNPDAPARVPTLPEFSSHVEDLMRSDRSLSRDAAVNLAASQWQGADIKEKAPRHPLSPMRLLGDDTYPRVRTEFGFASALGEPMATPEDQPEEMSGSTAPMDQPRPDTSLSVMGRRATTGQLARDAWAGQTPPQKDGLPVMRTVEEAMKLPPGTRFIDSNGVVRVRP